jgi:V/A-type H+-transporting ATPase subunit D
MSNATNKFELALRQRKLRLFAQVLPSLDLKRRQLQWLVNDERRRAQAAKAALRTGIDATAARLPMLATAGDLAATMLAAVPNEVSRIPIGVEHVIGIRLPRADVVVTPTWSGDELAMPPWCDSARRALLRLAVQQRETALRARRLALTQGALSRTLQRINLLEKRLMPQLRGEMQRMRDVLADEERAAIVRAKRVRVTASRDAQDLR